MLSIPADDAQAVALREAIQTGDVATLERQIRDQPELATARLVDGRGVSRTLLHVVADWPGHFPNGSRTVAVLIAAGADVDAPVLHPGPHGSPETALHWAASSDDVVVLDALLDGGADIEAPGAIFTGGTPLSDAVVFAQWGAARRLLERGARTTIWQAAALGVLERVRDLCSTDPPPPRAEITNAFWNACRGGQQPTAEYLLDRGADLNWVGHDGKTPLDAARDCGNEGFIQWLRSRGARSAVGAGGLGDTERR
jgi:ankyrin repeat protein